MYTSIEAAYNLICVDEVDYQRISLDELNDSEMSDLEGCLEPEGPFDGRLLGTDNTMSLSAYSDQTVWELSRNFNAVNLFHQGASGKINWLDFVS